MTWPPADSSPQGEPSPQRVEELFSRALDVDEAARSAFLDQACEGDLKLRQRVEQLLASSDAADKIPGWKEPALMTIARASADAAEPSLERYRLLERVGVGGMGVVYRAVRADDAFSKEVAIKIVQWAAGDETAIRRFRAERQILANLEHPGIARLLDGGETTDGTPFLVMEFIRGLPIDQYVAEHKLSQRDTLELFRRICSAVGYAHRMLIVHRDLKPGNILVTDGPDGVPEPKLLDFGIARLLDDPAQHTRTRTMTIEYASPEQVSGGPIGVASDLYSLGVLLYEIVTGTRPYRQTTSDIELAEAISNDAPLPISASIDADLTNIILMAMRKEPERRYESAGELSEDVRRFLEGYPVKARPDTRGYRARKFMARNRLPLAAAALIMITLAAGIFSTVRQARIANRRFNQVRNLSNYFVADVHDAIKDLPGSTPIRKIIVAKALEYLDGLSREHDNDRDLQSELAEAYERIANAQGGAHDPSNLGDNAGAYASYCKAAAIRERLVATHPKDRRELRGLAECYSALGSVEAQFMGDLQNGVGTLRKAVALAERAVAAGPRDADTEDVLADTYVMLGDALGNSSYQNLGDAKGATELYRKALGIREKLANAEPGNKARQMHLALSENRLGMILQSRGDVAGSIPMFRRVLEIDEKALAAEPRNTSYRINTATANRNLALVLSRSGQREGALPLTERAGELYAQVVREDPNDLAARSALAGNYYAIGSLLKDDAKAISLFDAAISEYLEIQRRHPGSAPEVGWRTALAYRAEAANHLGNTALAIASAEQLDGIAKELLKTSPDNFAAHRDRCRALSLVGEAYEIRSRKSGSSADRSRAESSLRQALDGYSSLEKKATLSRADRAAVKRASEALARLPSAK